MRNYLLLAVITLAAVATFSSRAVFLDEHIFLHIAQSARSNLLFPQETSWVFFGARSANLAAHTHPPAVEYYLALLLSVFGRFREVPFRLAFSIFPVAAVLAFYDLAQRFTRHALLVALLFAANPAFFIYSATVMMDVPLLAFLLVGFAVYFRSTEGKPALLPLAALCFVLAAGTGYTALVPLACLFIALAASRRPLRELLAVGAAPAALGVWLTAMTLHFHEFPLVRTVAYYLPQGSVIRNILVTVSFIGGICWFAAFAAGKLKWLGTAVPVTLLMTLFTSWPSLKYRVWYVVLACAGVMLLAAFLSGCRQIIAAASNRGEAAFILWVPAVLLFFILVSDSIDERYMLLAVAPLYLVIFHETPRRNLIYALIPTVILSGALAYADFTFVNWNRDFVAQNVVPLQQEGFRIWSAAESGLRFYLEERGITTLASTDTNPAPGDLIVRHQGLFRYGLSSHIEPDLIVLKTFSFNDAFPVRVYSAPSRAGFHDSGAGPAPFTFSHKAYDGVEVDEVSPLLRAAVWSPDGPIFIQRENETRFPLKLPPGGKIEYDVEGPGTVTITPDEIVLDRGPAPATVWKHFRVVPNNW